MKGTYVSAAVAALTGVATAASHRHAHANLFARGDKKGTEIETCVPTCTTVYETFYGEPTLYNPHAKPTSTACVVPTPIPEKCPTPGTYSWPATTITLNETTTVCAATTAKLPKGTHTYGGVTTVVATETTVVCPYATVKTNGPVVTSVIETTTYVCPSAGTYTIAPTVTTVTVEETVVVYPCVSSYEPGTYTKPAATVTVTETDYVTVCPWTGGPTHAPKPGKPEAPKHDKPDGHDKPGKPDHGLIPPIGLGGHGQDHWAVTYTPYTPDTGACKSRDTVLKDIRDMKRAGFNTLRVYSTDCDTLTHVGDACEETGLKMMVGIFVKQAGCGYSGEIQEQAEKIVAWKRWHLVDLFIVGNEAVFQGLCSADQLRNLIVKVKGIARDSAYSGPVTTAETVNVWEASSGALCDVVDIVGAQTHAYFNADTRPGDAGRFVKGQLDLVSKLCGKKALSTECGWPSAGECNGVACAGRDQQREAIDSIRKEIGSDVVLFDWDEAHWKHPGACNCEPFFSLKSIF